jgi:hypothetical protein
MAEESVLFEINLKDSLTKLAELKQQLDGLKENQKSLADAFDKGAVSAEDYAKGTEAVKVATKNVSAEYRSAQRLLEGYTGAQKDGIDTTNLANNSVRQNRLLLKQLTEQYNNTKNPSEAFIAQIKKLSDKLKEQEAKIGDNRRSVGSYAEGFKSAFNQIAEGFPVLNKFKTAQQGVNLVLSSNPIGGVVMLLTSLKDIVGGNAVVADNLKFAFDALNKGFRFIVDTVVTTVSSLDKLGAALRNPIQFIKDLANGTAQAAKEGFEASKALDEFTLSSGRLEIKIEKNQQQIDALTKSLKDRTKSEKDRIKIANDIADLEIKNADLLLQKNTDLRDAENLRLKGATLNAEEQIRLEKLQSEVENAEAQKKTINAQRQTRINILLEKEQAQAIKDTRKESNDALLKLQDEFLLSEREKLEKSFDAKAATITGTSEKELQLLKAINDAKTAALIKFDDDTAKKLNDARDAQERERIQKELTRINEQTSLQSILRDNELKEVELSVASEQDKIKRKKEINLAYLERQLDLAIQLGLADDKLTDTEIANIERLKLAIRELKENVAEPTPTISEVLGINETELNNAASALGGFQQLVGSLAQTFSALNQQRLNDIQTQYDTEIANVNRSALNKEEKEKKIAELERQKAREKYEQELAAFKTSKALQIVNATIATALAVIQGLQTGFSIPIVGVGLGPALAIAAAAAGAVQIGIIASQKPPAPPAFAEGGKVLSGRVIGNNDGVPIQRSNGDNLLATVKTGEVILNQRQQAALGGAATFRKIGVPGFATGGIVGDGGFTARSMTRASDERAFIQSAIRSGFMNAPQPVVTVEEINRVSDSSTNSVEVSEL